MCFEPLHQVNSLNLKVSVLYWNEGSIIVKEAADSKQSEYCKSNIVSIIIASMAMNSRSILLATRMPPH